MKISLMASACLVTALTAAAANAQTLVLEPYTVRDNMVVTREATTFLKPQGWKVSGGMKWYLNHSHQVCAELKVTNPQGLEQIETFPWFNCCWFTNPLFPMARGQNYLGDVVEQPVLDPREAVRKFTIPNMRAKYKPRIVSYKDMPDVAKALSAIHGGARVKAGKVRLEYDIDGETVEEDIYLAIRSVSQDFGNNNLATLWGPAWPPFSLRAAKGELDEKTPLMLAVVNSNVVNPRWFSEVEYVKSLFQERMAKGIQNAVDLSKTFRENGDAIFKMYSDSYWSGQASQERVFRNFSHYIRGVTPYHNPFQKGGTVNLPNTHQYVWGSATGGFMLSNNANFDPNQNSSHTWQLLKQSR